MKYRLSVIILLCSCTLSAQDTLFVNDTCWTGTLKDGKRNGLWEEYSNGTLLSRGWFRNDVREGPWEYYSITHYGDNEVIASGLYRNGIKEGEWFYSGGYQYWKGNYTHGKKAGEWLCYDAELGDILIYKGLFVNGMVEGRFEKYREDGSLAAAGMMAESQPAGVWHIYHDGGSLAACGELIINPDTIIPDFDFMNFNNELYRIGLDCDPNYSTHDKKGEWKYYHSNAVLSSAGVYANGKKEGKWTSFYDNGNIQYTGIYRNGKKEGEWKGFHTDGRLRSVENYSGGLLNGPSSYYGGERWSHATGFYSLGNRSGEWSLWINDTMLLQRASYNGLPYETDPGHPALTYYVPGNYCSLEKVTYEVEVMFNNNSLPSGNRHGAWEEHNLHGGLKARGSYANGKYTGRWEHYSKEGELMSIYHYRDGLLDGKFAEFSWYWKYVWRMGCYRDNQRIEYHEFEKGEGMTREEYLLQAGS